MSDHCPPSNNELSCSNSEFYTNRSHKTSAIFTGPPVMDEISNQLHDLSMEESNDNNSNTEQSVELNNLHSKSNTFNCFMDSCESYINQRLADSTALHEDEAPHVEDISERKDLSNILVVTNVDSRLFNSRELQSQFESLFNVYDSNITFRYLKSFRRIRLDFSSPEQAEAARVNYNSFTTNSISKCYSVRLINPYLGSSHLLPPTREKQFLISPPVSPPQGWKPHEESSPCIDIQLISAIANLVPGKTHLIHEATDSQPGIVVEVCDDLRMQGDKRIGMKHVARIGPTARPY